MKIQTIKDFFAPSAWRLGGAVKRAAMTLLLFVLTTMTAWAVDITVHVTGGGTVTYDETHSVTRNGEFTISANCGDNISLTITPDDGSIVKEAKYYWEELKGHRFYSADLTLSGTTGSFTVSENTVRINVNIVFESVGLAGGTEDEPVAITDNTETVLSGGWYVVSSDITFDHTLTLRGSTVLSLASGATMTINSNGNGIDASNTSYSLTVCGEGNLIVTGYTAINVGSDYTQTGGNVTLSATLYGISCNTATISGGSLSVTMSKWGITTAQNLTISGGTVNVIGSERGLRAGLYLYITGGSVTAKGDEYWDVFGEASVNITGGQVTAVTRGINSYLGSIILGCTNATDFITASRYGGTVKIADGKAMTDGTNIYDENTESDVLKALTNTTLRPVTYTVTFDINYDEGTSPEAQTVLLGEKATEPTVDARTGYIFGGWKNGDADYDFNTAVTTDLYLTAEWTPITYTVQFDKNNDDATGTMDAVVATYDQWTSIPVCTFTAPEGKALKEYGWNTEADGSGTDYEAEGDFRNLASEQGATVTLYAQWGKDIDKWCTATVPDPIYHSGYTHNFFYDGTWNDNHGGIKVYDGKTLLTYGTDYRYTRMESLDGGSCENLGEHCRVYLQGLGAYAGILYKDVVIVPTTVTNATWGDLTWSLDGDGKFTITGTGAMDAASDNSDYDWYNYSSYFTSITIGEEITTVAAKAFGGDNNTNPYGGVTSVKLPSTLTTIGEKAFAYCTGATFNVDNLLAKGVTIGEDALNQVGCIVGTLQDKADNSNMLSFMANAATANVTIKGRTLYKDGNWNTICLPFDVKSDNALLTGATVKELDLFGYYDAEGNYYPYYDANFTRTCFDAENGALYLYFKDATADSDDNLLKAGTPYLIKWPSGTDITGDLTFEGVKVVYSPQTPTSEDKNVSFRGTFSPVKLTGGDASNLYLGVSTNDNDTPEDNIDDFQQSTLYYPAEGHDRTINSFRAYFHVDLSTTSGVRAFVLNFGDNDETTGIVSIENGKLIIDNWAGAGWYDLSGRRLPGKPTKKGVYINNGIKKVIK